MRQHCHWPWCDLSLTCDNPAFNHVIRRNSSTWHVSWHQRFDFWSLFRSSELKWCLHALAYVQSFLKSQVTFKTKSWTTPSFAFIFQKHTVHIHTLACPWTLTTYILSWILNLPLVFLQQCHHSDLTTNNLSATLSLSLLHSPSLMCFLCIYRYCFLSWHPSGYFSPSSFLLLQLLWFLLPVHSHHLYISSQTYLLLSWIWLLNLSLCFCHLDFKNWQTHSADHTTCN